MKTYLLLSLSAVCLSGCAGLDITPISAADDMAAHSGNTNLKGYVIYEPMVVVEITQKEVCIDKDDNGTCRGGTEITCSAGKPFTLPDTSKPFLIQSRSGLGKAGVDVTINDGWQLGNIKDNSDNTAILGTVQTLLGLKTAIATTGNAARGTCKASGLYRVNIQPSGVALTPLLVY